MLCPISCVMARLAMQPELTTLNRQITAYLSTIIKPDEADGHSRIERVLIPKCKGLQID